MALPVNLPLHAVLVWAYAADISAASSAFGCSPAKGTILEVGVTIYNAITGTNSVCTAKIAGTSITLPTWTITQSGSAAGDNSSVVPTGANVIGRGQVIEFVSDGASSTTCPAMFYAIILRDI